MIETTRGDVQNSTVYIHCTYSIDINILLHECNHMYFKVCRLYTYLYVYLRVRFSEKEEWKIKTKVALCLMFVITLSSSFYDGQGLKLSFIHRNVLKKHERDSRLVQKLRKIKIIHYSNTCYYKAVPFLINSEFNTGCDGLYSYSLFIFLLGDLNCEYFFCSLGWKSGLNFLSQFCSHLNY